MHFRIATKKRADTVGRRNQNSIQMMRINRTGGMPNVQCPASKQFFPRWPDKAMSAASHTNSIHTKTSGAVAIPSKPLQTVMPIAMVRPSWAVLFLLISIVRRIESARSPGNERTL